MGTAASSAPVTACIALGANLGDAQRTVETAINAIGELSATQLVARSSLYRTAPVDSSGPDYVNAVVAVRTQLQPEALLAALQALEAAAGRERPWRNAPRTLDLDILLYGDERIATESLTVPHPRMLDRAFVLVPLAEIAPRLVTLAQLRAVAGQALQKL